MFRKVKFKYWHGEDKKWVEGAAGKFHQWANGYEEFKSGPGNYTFAIIELPSGQIVTAMPEDVIFLTEGKDTND